MRILGLLGAAAAAALVATTGCAAREIKWTEEVELHDGRVVQVKRRTELTPTGFPAQKTGFEKCHELCYASSPYPGGIRRKRQW